MASDDAAFARSAENCIFGKCTAEIRFRVPEEAEEIAIRKANEAGMSLAEFGRMAFLIGVFGIDEVARLQTERLNIIAGIGRK